MEPEESSSLYCKGIVVKAKEDGIGTKIDIEINGTRRKTQKKTPEPMVNKL